MNWDKDFQDLRFDSVQVVRHLQSLPPGRYVAVIDKPPDKDMTVGVELLESYENSEIVNFSQGIDKDNIS